MKNSNMLENTDENGKKQKIREFGDNCGTNFPK